MVYNVSMMETFPNLDAQYCQPVVFAKNWDTFSEGTLENKILSLAYFKIKT